eukprot:5899544-Pyramimonas_sp.AAC.1
MQRKAGSGRRGCDGDHIDARPTGRPKATGRRRRPHSRQTDGQAQKTGGDGSATGRRRRPHSRHTDGQATSSEKN